MGSEMCIRDRYAGGRPSIPKAKPIVLLIFLVLFMPFKCLVMPPCLARAFLAHHLVFDCLFPPLLCMLLLSRGCQNTFHGVVVAGGSVLADDALHVLEGSHGGRRA